MIHPVQVPQKIAIGSFIHDFSLSMSEVEDEELLAAAANWAGAEIVSGDDEKGGVVDGGAAPSEQHAEALSQVNPRRQRGKSNQKFSLHVTQLSYNATDYDIRSLFSTQGCLVTDLRMVYKNRDDTARREFSGVAFVDVKDEASFSLALQLHRKIHLGRKINVRPTRSREELGQIVEATREKVAAIIQSSGGRVPGTKGPASANKKPEQSNRKPKTGQKSKEKAGEKGSESKRPPHSSRGKKNIAKFKPPNRKMTKKERNRKAAILLRRQRAKK
jgi:RNA recognition motif-containing protein